MKRWPSKYYAYLITLIIALLFFASISFGQAIQKLPNGNVNNEWWVRGFFTADSAIVPPYKLSTTYRFLGQFWYSKIDSAMYFWNGVDSVRFSTGASSGTVTSITAGAGLSGGTITTSGTISMPNTGTGAGTVGNSTSIPVITFDAQGRETAYTTAAITTGSGTVTSVTAGIGLSGGTFTTAGTVSMPSVGTASTHGSSTIIPIITTDAQGRVTTLSDATIAAVTSFSVTAGTGISIGGSPITSTGTITVTNTIDTVTAGTGLSGGKVSHLNTVSMPNVGTAGTYGGNGLYAATTTDAQGRVAGISTGAMTISYSNIISPANQTVSFTPTGDVTGATSSTTNLAPSLTITYQNPAPVASWTTSVVATSTAASQAQTVTYRDTAQSTALLFSAPTGSWADFQFLVFNITSDGSAHALTYNSIFHNGASSTQTLPTTTIASKKLKIVFQYVIDGPSGPHFDLIGFENGIDP